MCKRLKEVENFSEFQYPSREGDVIQMIWQVVVRKGNAFDDWSLKDVANFLQCLLFLCHAALFCSGMDRKELKLRVTGRIWKEQQNPETGVCMPTFVAKAKVILKTSTRLCYSFLLCCNGWN